MKTLYLFLLGALASCSVFSQSFTPVNEGSAIKFKIKNLGFNVGGSFSGITGTIRFDPAAISSASFDVNIDAKTVNTGNETRDSHLQDDTYFDVKNYPNIHFVSTSITAAGKKNNFTLTGKLTIKKTTKEISFPFSAVATGAGYVFDGEFKINRTEFEVGNSAILSDIVPVTLHVVAKK